MAEEKGMVVAIKNFKELAKNKEVKQKGSRKSKTLFSKIGNLKEKFKNWQTKRLDNKLTKIDNNLNRIENSIEYFEKLAREAETESARKSALDMISQKKEEQEKYLAEKERYMAKKDKLLNSEEVEITIEEDLKNYFPSVERERLQTMVDTYYDKKTNTFEIGNEKFELNNLSAEEKAEVYGKALEAFNKLENNDDFKNARLLEVFGNCAYNGDFIKKFSKLDENDRFLVVSDLAHLSVVKMAELKNKNPKLVIDNFLSLDKKEQETHLKKVKFNSQELNEEYLQELRKLNEELQAQEEQNKDQELPEIEPEPTYEPKVENSGKNTDRYYPDPDENYETEKPIETPVPTEPEPTYEPEVEEPTFSQDKINEYNANKDEYTINIENAQNRIAEIDAKIADAKSKQKSFIENNAQTFASGFNVGVGDIIADNAGAYKDQIAEYTNDGQALTVGNLETEREALMQEIRQNEEARRAAKIQADKKAREERLNEIDRKFKEQWEENKKAQELEEAKSVLSHLKTDTGFYDISNLTDEEILEVYNSIKASPSMESRIKEAQKLSEEVVAPSQKPNPTEEPEIERPEETPAPVEPVPTEEPEVVNENTSSLESLSAEEKAQLNEQSEYNQDTINNIMNIYGVDKEQAMEMYQSGNPEIKQMINEMKNNIALDSNASENHTEEEIQDSHPEITADKKIEELLNANIYGSKLAEKFTAEEIEDYMNSHPEMAPDRALDQLAAIDSLDVEQEKTNGRSR